MEWLENQSKIVAFIKKYRYVFFIVFFGIFLMMIPEKTEEPIIVYEQNEKPLEDLETSLEEIISKIDGAGKTSVLLTQASGSETIYEENENTSISSEMSDKKKETVIITDSSRNENGLIRKIIPPVYRGAIIVCQGADSAVIRLSIVEAVSKVTGLSTNQISVLKMK